jgi:hypothetical protein
MARRRPRVDASTLPYELAVFIRPVSGRVIPLSGVARKLLNDAAPDPGEKPESAVGIAFRE